MDNDLFAPDEQGGKRKFGMLRLHARKVKLQSGASYTIPGLTNRDGEIWEFKGKQPDEASNTRHIVLDVEVKSRDGGTYHTFRDAMSFDKWYKEIVYPSLKKNFGSDLSTLTTTPAPVEVEEVPYKDREYERTTLRVLRRFASVAEMEAAEKAHFARFGNTTDIEASAASSNGTFNVADWSYDKADMQKKFDEARAAKKSIAQALGMVAKEYELEPDQVKAVLSA